MCFERIKVIWFVFMLYESITCEPEIGRIEFDLSSGSGYTIVHLAPNASTILYAVNIRLDVTSVVFGAHSQKNNITLSYVNEPVQYQHVSGKNIGLTYVLPNNASDALIWLMNSNNHEVPVFIKLIAYSANDPVPGGCNMEFPVEIAPYVLLIDDQFSTHVEFQLANVGSSRHMKPPSCSKSIAFVSYDIFVLFLEEHTYTEEEYFKGLQHMSNVSFLLSKAKKIYTYVQHPQTRATFLKYPKTGAVYNVIAKYNIDGSVREAAYVPSATYGCTLVSENFGCGLPYTEATKPMLLFLSVFGLFIALCGHRFFTAGTFYFGFIISIFVSFILISKYDLLWTASRTLLFTIVLGTFGGIFWMTIWILFYRSVISVLLISFVLGFLLSATVLYTPLGNYSIFINDRLYWIFLCSGPAVVTAVLFPFPKAASIIGSSVVGSYTSILYLDDYVGSSLIFIIVNVVKKALADKSIFAAINDFPFQRNNVIVSFCWVTTAVISIAIQTYMNWKKPFSIPWCTCLRVKYPGCTCSSTRLTVSRNNERSNGSTQALLHNCTTNYNSCNA